jgi:hypothetical protein
MSNGNSVEFGGWSWNTASKPAPPQTAPPPTVDTSPPPPYGENMWMASNVGLDAYGNLTLSVQQNSGYMWNGSAIVQYVAGKGFPEIWAAAQAALVLPQGTQLAYGTFCVTVIAGTADAPSWTPYTGLCTASGAETNTIFGAFTFDLGQNAEPPYGEIDVVEIGYQAQNQAPGWINTQPGGPSANSDAHFCVQPWNGPGATQGPDWSYVHQFALDPDSIPAGGAVTFAAIWAENAPIQFYAAYDAFTADDFPFDSAPFYWVSGVNGPAPTPTLTFCLNLWPYGGPSTGQPQTFTVTAVSVPTTTTSPP